MLKQLNSVAGGKFNPFLTFSYFKIDTWNFVTVQIFKIWSYIMHYGQILIRQPEVIKKTIKK